MGSYLSFLYPEQYVTHEELATHFKQLREGVEKYKEKSEKYKDKYEDCKDKYDRLMTDYLLLQEEFENQIVPRGIADNNISHISLTAIKDHVDQNILATDANSKWVPDALERKAYISIYKSVLESILQLSNTSSLTSMNHKITMNIQPISSYK